MLIYATWKINNAVKVFFIVLPNEFTDVNELYLSVDF